MGISFRKCTTTDVSALRDFSKRTYYGTFNSWCDPNDMDVYCAEAFDTDKLRSELLDESSDFYFLYANGVLAGYLKLNEAPAQTDLHDGDALELERIYVAKGYQGQGLGATLMEKALSIAAERNKQYIWLGVWEKNKNAISFYKRHGFYQMGTHAFVMGDDVQTDFIMRKDLQPRMNQQ